MAKKIKPVKKAAPKKTVKKGVARSASPKRKKAAVKKAAPKKVVAKKKAVAKPASRKGKKPAAKKVAVKKAAPKKAVAKKVTAKKAAVKKLPAKKVAAAKVAARPTPPVVKKKTVLATMPKPEAVPLPPVEERSENLVEKAANLDTGSGQMMVPGDGLNDAPLITEDPVRTFDQNEFNKATANGQLHSNMRFNSKPKNTVKPSGKKPLWNK